MTTVEFWFVALFVLQINATLCSASSNHIEDNGSWVKHELVGGSVCMTQNNRKKNWLKNVNKVPVCRKKRSTLKAEKTATHIIFCCDMLMLRNWPTELNIWKVQYCVILREADKQTDRLFS